MAVRSTQRMKFTVYCSIYMVILSDLICNHQGSCNQLLILDYIKNLKKKLNNGKIWFETISNTKEIFTWYFLNDHWDVSSPLRGLPADLVSEGLHDQVSLAPDILLFLPRSKRVADQRHQQVGLRKGRHTVTLRIPPWLGPGGVI